MSTGRRSAIWTVLVMAGAVALAAVGYDRSGAQQQDTDALAPNGLQLQSRDHVAICIQMTPEATTPSEKATAAVRAVLPRLQASPRWDELALGKQTPDIDVGCPTEPYLLRPGVDGKRMFREIDVPRTKSQPSKYLVQLMVLSDSQVDKLFGDVKYPSMRIETHEYFCPRGGDACVGVSAGLYLSDAELRDEQYLWVLLNFGLGLGNEMPIPAPEGTMRDRLGRPIQRVEAGSRPVRSPVPTLVSTPGPSPVTDPATR